MHDSAVPAALVRDGEDLVLVIREGLLPDDVVDYLDRLLDAGLSPLLDGDGEPDRSHLGATANVASTGASLVSLTACNGLD